MGILAQFLELVLAGFGVDLVRVIGREQIGFVTCDAHRFSDAELLTLAADENAAIIDMPNNVVDNFFALLELQETAARVVLHVAFPGAGEALHAGQKPGSTGSHETDTQARKSVEDAVKDNPAETNHLAHGMAESVRHSIGTHVVHQKIFMSATVDR